MSSYIYTTILIPPIYSISGEFSLALGATTIVKMTTASGLSFYGITMTGGSPSEGMMVTFVIQTTGFNNNFTHDSVLASSPTHRFLNPSGGVSTFNGFGAVTYRYDATFGTPAGRWVQISRT